MTTHEAPELNSRLELWFKVQEVAIYLENTRPADDDQSHRIGDARLERIRGADTALARFIDGFALDLTQVPRPGWLSGFLGSGAATWPHDNDMMDTIAGEQLEVVAAVLSRGTDLGGDAVWLAQRAQGARTVLREFSDDTRTGIDPWELVMLIADPAPPEAT